MKYLTIICVLCMIFSINNATAQKQQKNQPDERVEVNKQYDKHGNLIRYDSIYSYSYSSSDKNMKLHTQKMDSIMKNFFPNEFSNFFSNSKKKFSEHPFSFLQRRQSIDSLWKQRMEMQRKFMEQFLQQQSKNETAPKNILKKKI